MGTTTHEHAVYVITPELVAQRPHGANEIVDTVLSAHLAKVHEEMCLAFPPCGIGRIRVQSAEIRSRAHDEHVVGADVPTVEC
jgi:hypothetical protein